MLKTHMSNINNFGEINSIWPIINYFKIKIINKERYKNIIIRYSITVNVTHQKLRRKEAKSKCAFVIIDGIIEFTYGHGSTMTDLSQDDANVVPKWSFQKIS